MKEKLTYYEVYDRYKNLVLKVAYDYSGDFDAAEDIMQNTFLKLYMYFENMRQDNLKAWLYTTAKHAAINYRRKADKEVLEESEDSTIDRLSGVADSAEAEVFCRKGKEEAACLHERIMTDMMGKNPRWHEAIMMVYVMEIPQTKVAEKMGISVNVLYSMLHRAKEWIQKEYGVEYQEMKRGN